MLLGTAALAALGVSRRGVRQATATARPRRPALRSSTWPAATASWPATPPPPRRPQQRPALTAVASERSDHAQALSDEIARLTGETTASATTTTTSHARRPTRRRPTRTSIAALRKSADSAAQLAAQMSGYRAGLLGSIAASCTAAYTVALAPRTERRDLARTHADDDLFAAAEPTSPSGRRTPMPPPCSTRWPPSTRSSTATGWCRRIPPPRTTTWCRRRWRSTANGARPRSRCSRAARWTRRCLPPAISCRRRWTTRPTPRTSRCAWKRTPRWRGGRCSSRRPPARTRAFAVKALTQTAVTAARWSRVLGVWPITVAFPGGSE